MKSGRGFVEQSPQAGGDRDKDREQGLLQEAPGSCTSLALVWGRFATGTSVGEGSRAVHSGSGVAAGTAEHHPGLGGSCPGDMGSAPRTQWAAKRLGAPRPVPMPAALVDKQPVDALSSPPAPWGCSSLPFPVPTPSS